MVRKPTMKDYEGLAEMEGLGDFYKNRVTRVLLVAAFTNLGAMLASVIVVPALLRVVVG
jgi:pheromone shutdown protein TraB